MNNNDVLRTLRYALELDNHSLLAIFSLRQVSLSARELAAMLKGDEEEGFVPLSDELLGKLLDGLIVRERGVREDAPDEPRRAAELSNNRILRALRIALELKDTDVIAILGLAGVKVTKAEIGALFRREDHRNYQPCGDQFLRNFLRGLGLWHRQGRPRA